MRETRLEAVVQVRDWGLTRGIGSRDGEERLDWKIRETADSRVFLLQMG